MKTILMLYYYLFIVLHCWGLLCLLIYVPTREVTCITLSRKKKSIPNQQLYVCRRLSHTNLEWWTLKMTIALWIQKYFKIKRILEESHTSILEPNGNMEKWIKNLINKSIIGKFLLGIEKVVKTFLISNKLFPKLVYYCMPLGHTLVKSNFKLQKLAI